MPKKDDSDAIKEVLTKIGLPASSPKSGITQEMKASIQQNLERFYQEEKNSKAFALPKSQTQFLDAIYRILEEMPYMAENLMEYHSFKASILTLITRNTWKNY